MISIIVLCYLIQNQNVFVMSLVRSFLFSDITESFLLYHELDLVISVFGTNFVMSNTRSFYITMLWNNERSLSDQCAVSLWSIVPSLSDKFRGRNFILEKSLHCLRIIYVLWYHLFDFVIFIIQTYFVISQNRLMDFIKSTFDITIWRSQKACFSDITKSIVWYH